MANIRGALRKTIPVLLLIALGVSFEWLMLTNTSPQSVIAAIRGPLPAPAINYQRPTFQTGVVFPQWGADAYSPSNHNYAFGLGEITQQTAARWVELPVNLDQSNISSTQVSATSYTPTPQSVYQGILTAHRMGYHVFIVPLLSVGHGAWSGYVHFSSDADTQAWFTSYWRAYAPYVVAAQRAGAEQLAIGTEFTMLELASPSLWNTLIAKAHAIFHGRLTYDMNWSTLDSQPPSWMFNPALGAIGVSEYLSLAPTSQRLDPALLPGLWKQLVRRRLDQLALRLGKQVVVSEIAYRNSSDTGYYPFVATTKAPADPTEQAAAYNAALQNCVTDPLIGGIYFWGWSIPVFAPNWLPAAQTMRHWYTSPLA